MSEEDDFDEFDMDDTLEEIEELSEEDESTEEDSSVAEQVNKNLQTGSKSSEMGHVIASRNLRISQEYHEIFCYVHSDSREEVRLGDYVLLPYPEPTDEDRQHAEMFGVVSGMDYAHRTEINDKEDMRGGLDNGGDIDERRYTLIAKVKPIAVIHGREDSDLQSRSVDMIPKPSTYVYPADNEDYLRTGLNIPEEGPFIGYMAVTGETRPRDNPLPFKMPDDDEEGEPAIFRHTLVGGSTGKGKTHFTKNILRQYSSDKQYGIQVSNPNEGTGTEDDVAKKQLATLIIDPENEYTELGEDNPELPDDEDEPIPELDGKTINDLEDEGIRVGGINDQHGDNDLRTYIPDVEYTNPPDVKDSYEFSIPFKFVKEHYQLLMPFEPGEATRAAVRDCVREYFSKVDDDDATYSDFKDFMEDGKEWIEASDEEIRNGTVPRRGNWVDDYSFNESIYNAVMRRVIRPEYGYIFDNGATPLDEASKEMFKEGRTTVVPTNHLRGVKERLVVMALLAHVVDNKLKDRNPAYEVKDSPVLLVLDEAHNYLSEPSTAQEMYIVNKYRNASRQGRKYKLGLFMVTQNPNDIDEEIRKQTNSSIYLGLEPEVIENLRIPGGFDSRIQNFGKGEAIVKAPDVRAVEVKGLPVCLTKHSK